MRIAKSLATGTAALCCLITLAFGTTLQWDANANWPVGTTVEACLNAECVSGIAGNEQAFATPPPGTVLNARARAVPPAGYQCGDPLADCPPSPWAELAQTLPADQLPPSRSGWVTGGAAAMAISYLGYVTVDATGDISQAITVPANTDYALIFRGGWASTAQTVTAISLDGTAATSIRVVAATNTNQDIYLYGVPVSSGSKTLVHNLSGTFAEGGKVTVAFFSGVDTSNPVVASDYTQYAADASGTDSPTWALSSVADGIGAVFVNAYNSSTSITMTPQSQTSVFNNLTYTSNIDGFGYKSTSGTSTTFGCSVTIGGGSKYWTGVAVSLRAASGASAKSLPPHLTSPSRAFAHLLPR